MRPPRWTYALAAVAALAIGCSSTPSDPQPPLDNGSSAGIGDAPASAPAAKPSPSASHKAYASCEALRADFPDGVPKGHWAYRLKLDRDHDGKACEPDGD